VKRIEAIIGPSKLDGVKYSVLRTGARGMTVSEIRELGHVSSRRETYRDSTCKEEFAPRVRVQIVAPDEMVDPIVQAIVAAARAGKAGDGRIIVSPVAEVIRVRTGERGAAAI
jgi:nitrogen regulatory protein P-II 1